MAPPKRKNKKCLECNHIFRRYKRSPTYDERIYKQVCPKCGIPASYNKTIPYKKDEE